MAGFYFNLHSGDHTKGWMGAHNTTFAPIVWSNQIHCDSIYIYIVYWIYYRTCCISYVGYCIRLYIIYIYIYMKYTSDHTCMNILKTHMGVYIYTHISYIHNKHVLNTFQSGLYRLLLKILSLCNDASIWMPHHTSTLTTWAMMTTTTLAIHSHNHSTVNDYENE